MNLSKWGLICQLLKEGVQNKNSIHQSLQAGRGDVVNRELRQSNLGCALGVMSQAGNG